MDGQDGRISPKKYNSLHFLAAPEARKVPDIFDKGPKALGIQNGGLIQDKALVDSTEAAIVGIIGKKKDAIEKKFGRGSSDWLMKNLQMFDPEEKYKLYYMFEGLLEPKINSKMSSPDPEPSLTHERLKANPGGVRG